MRNNVHIMGRVFDIEQKSYDDGATITYFKLAYPKVSRSDEFTCRIIKRKNSLINSRPFKGVVAEGETIDLSGILTTAGSRGDRVIIDVHWWELVKELV